MLTPFWGYLRGRLERRSYDFELVDDIFWDLQFFVDVCLRAEKLAENLLHGVVRNAALSLHRHGGLVLGAHH